MVSEIVAKTATLRSCSNDKSMSTRETTSDAVLLNMHSKAVLTIYIRFHMVL